MSELAGVSSHLCQIYREPHDGTSAEDYVMFSTSLRDSLQFTVDQIDKFFERSSKTFVSCELSAFITRLHHITAEIGTLFPQGKLDPNMTCAKPEVEDWWRRNFNQRVIVPRDEFFRAFFAKHARFQRDNKDLYETMAFTSESYVSKYALDLFTRLFSPWEKSYNVHKALTQHPAYLKQSTSSLIEEKLQALKDKPGSFYFRISVNNPGIWSIGFVTRNGHISQVLCYGLPLIDTLHQSRDDLYVYPAGSSQAYDLSNDIEQGKQVFVKDDPTCDPLKCRLCEANQIDLQFDQCGHMCCHRCNRSLMSEALRTKDPRCPFCQKLILSTSFIKLSIGEYYSDVTNEPPPVKSPPPPSSRPFADSDPSARRQNTFSGTKSSPMNGSKPPVPKTPPFDSKINGESRGSEPQVNNPVSLDRSTSSFNASPGRAQWSHSAPNTPRSNTAYGARFSPNVRLDKAAKREEQLQALAQRAGKPENVMQTAVCFLVNRGHDEDSVFEALMESCGDRDKALKILENRKTSAPAVISNTGYGARVSPNVRLDKAAKREEQLQALAQRAGKPANVMQTAVCFLVNRGHEEDSVFDALMESCGDRDKALKILENRKTSAPAVISNTGYGARVSPNVRLDKAAKREEQLQALAQRAGKPANVMQTAVCFLVNRGHEEDSVFDALMESCGDRDKALKILENRKTSAPAVISNTGYGARASPNVRHDKATMRADRLRKLSEQTNKSELAMHTAMARLTNRGFGEEAAFEALMSSDGDVDKALEMLKGQA
ncbi:hypothetical protein AAHC03_04374 [Spirometra sp. Aus1]